MTKYNTFILLIFSLFVEVLSGQNLIKNNSFEEHNPIKCLICDVFYDKFEILVPSWGIMNSSALLCDCDYKRNYDEIQKGNHCDTEKIKPKSGKAFIEMFYHSRCVDDARETWGCSSYLTTEFETPLTLGNVYEISFWLYIPTIKNTDTTFASNIGITLLPYMIISPNRAMLHGHDLLVDDVIFDKWYQVKWYVRPTCNLKHLVIGTFRNQNFPSIHEHIIKSLYFIDDVVVRKVEKTEIVEKSIVTPFCKPTDEVVENEIIKIDKQVLHFETNESWLSDSEKTKLDIFAKAAKAQPNVVFWVSGYTDSKGNNHETLSKARANAVIQYLTETHKIPNYRFISTFEGDKNPIASNDTEEGRKQNRRVEIKHTMNDLSQVIYYNMMIYNELNNIDSAFLLMNIWLHISKKPQQILALYDSRLENMQNDKRWKGVEMRIEKNYLSFKKPEYAFELEKLWAADQKYRTLTRHLNNLGYVPILKDLALEEPDFPDNWEALDKANFEKLESLIKKYGFPNADEVGKLGQKTAFLMIIHLSDTAKMETYLKLIENLCLKGEADWIYYVTLFDRIKLLKKEPQRFGTQSVIAENGEQHLYQLEDETKVNEYRERLGLFPIDLEHKED